MNGEEEQVRTRIRLSTNAEIQIPGVTLEEIYYQIHYPDTLDDPSQNKQRAYLRIESENRTLMINPDQIVYIEELKNGN